MDKLKAKCSRLKKCFNPTDIYSSQRPVLLTLFCKGLFPFKIAGNASNRTLRISKSGYALAAYHIVFFLVAFVVTLCRHESFALFFFPTDVTRLGGYLQFFTSIIAMATIYGSCIYSSKKLQILLANIFNIDKRFKLLNVEINHAVGFKLNIYCVIVFLIVNLSFTFLSYVLLASADEDKVPGFAVWTSYFVPPFIISLLVMHFFCIMFQMKYRFVHLNQVSNNGFSILITLRKG